MINNISGVNANLQQMNVVKAMPSKTGISLPPILGFRTPIGKGKANLRVKKFKRSDNIIIPGVIDDDYVDIVEENDYSGIDDANQSFTFVNLMPKKKTTRYLKDCYIIDYIQTPQAHCGLGTEALKGLAEKAMFDPKNTREDCDLFGPCVAGIIAGVILL